MPPVKARARPGPLLRTARLVLRPFRKEDQEPLARLLGELEDRSLFDAGGRRLSPARLAAGMIRESRHVTDRDCLHLNLAIRLKGGRRLIGGARFFKDAGGEAEIGLWFAPGHQGRGLGRESLQGLFRLGFDKLGCRRISGTCDADNAVSRKLMESGGMQPQGTFEAEDAAGHAIRRTVYSLNRPAPAIPST